MTSSRYYDSAHHEFVSARMADLCQEVFQHPSPNDYLSSLSEGDRAMFYVVSLITQVDNGGLFEYLCGPYGEDIIMCIDYLRKISADQVADDLYALLAALPKGIHHNDRERTEKILIAFCRKNAIEELEQLFPIDIGKIDIEKLLEYRNNN